jgi:hypothetical protein
VLSVALYFLSNSQQHSDGYVGSVIFGKEQSTVTMPFSGHCLHDGLVNHKKGYQIPLSITSSNISWLTLEH